MTRRFAVIGDPVEHSRSPRIHDAAYAALDLDAAYTARTTGPGDLDAVIDELRDGRFDGLNVTMPLKGAAAARCEVLDAVATRLGSVNTLTMDRGRLEGASTDGAGILHGWSLAGLPGDVPVLVLGAGGAARAAVDTLARRQPVFVSARRADAASALLELGAERTIAWGDGMAGAVVVNATPIGMRGGAIPEPILDDALGFFEMVYAPERTPSVLSAEERGLPIGWGIDMLVGQAAASFARWFGMEPPLEAMTAAAKRSSTP